ncbi:MAG: primosomal protein N', partial [Flavobacteriia bacterium]
MTERQTLFADVLLPVPMRQVFTYRVPFDFNGQIRSGLRVLVPFGKNKILTGLVTNVHQNVPQTYQAKYIDTILDDSPIITCKQLAFWDWLSSYYMAPIGDVMNAALPANFKLASESKFCLHPDAPIPRPELSTRATEIIELLEVQSQMSSKEI